MRKVQARLIAALILVFGLASVPALAQDSGAVDLTLQCVTGIVMPCIPDGQFSEGERQQSITASYRSLIDKNDFLVIVDAQQCAWDVVVEFDSNATANSPPEIIAEAGHVGHASFRARTSREETKRALIYATQPLNDDGEVDNVPGDGVFCLQTLR